MKPVCTALLLTLFVLAGCGGSGEKTKTVTVEQSATASPAATAGAAASPTAEASAPEKTIATREGSVDDARVRLDITHLKRSGSTLALTFTLTNLEQENSDGGHVQVSGTFDDGIFEKVDGGTSIIAGSTLDGISLIDTKNDKRHLVGRDETGQCVCDVDLSATFVDPGTPVTLSATFGAPPDDVTSMSVVVPHFGTLADVPLS